MIQENLKVLRLKKRNVSRGAGSADSCRTSNCLQMGKRTFSAGRTNTDSDCAGLGSTGFSVFGRNNPGGKRGGHAANNGKKAGGNQHLSSGTVRSYSPQNPDYCDCYDPLAFAGIVLLLLFSTGLLHQPPSGPNVIGGADGATGILIVGTNWFAFGVGMAVCICALIAGGILLHRSKR